EPLEAAQRGLAVALGLGSLPRIEREAERGLAEVAAWIRPRERGAVTLDRKAGCREEVVDELEVLERIAPVALGKIAERVDRGERDRHPLMQAKRLEGLSVADHLGSDGVLVQERDVVDLERRIDRELPVGWNADLACVDMVQLADPERFDLRADAAQHFFGFEASSGCR